MRPGYYGPESSSISRDNESEKEKRNQGGSGMDVHGCGKHHDQKQLGRKGFIASYCLIV